MAAGTLQKPGTKLGPCLSECNHSDCKLTRLIADSKCVHCGKAIGYETGFYQIEKSDDFAHASCAEDRADWAHSFTKARLQFVKHLAHCPCESVCACEFSFKCATCGRKVTIHGEMFEGGIDEINRCNSCKAHEAGQVNTTFCPECGSENISDWREDGDGWIDCFDCGLFFDPAHPDNQTRPQPVEA